MPISRRHLLYLMLAALGFAGASGVAALLIGDAGTVWRCAGTGLAAAIAAGFMMPMAGWADKPATRAAGLTGMGLAIVELCFGAVLIWGMFLSSGLFEFLGLTTLIVGVGGLLTVRFLKEIHADRWRLASRGGAVSCAAASIIFIIAAYDEAFNRSLSTGDQIAESALGVFLSGTIGSLALYEWRPGSVKGWRSGNCWRLFGAAAAALALGLVLYRTWGDTKALRAAWEVGAYGLAAFVAHSNACLQARLVGWQRHVRVLAIASAGATVFAVTQSAWNRDYPPDVLGSFEGAWRFISACGLLCVSSTLALLVVGRLNKRAAVELSKSSFDHVSLVCPRCAKKLVLPVGGALCSDCKLHIDVAIRVARCATCGYDLSGLRSGTCPECGTPIPLSDGAIGPTPGIQRPAVDQMPRPVPFQQTPNSP